MRWAAGGELPTASCLTQSLTVPLGVGTGEPVPACPLSRGREPSPPLLQPGWGPADSTGRGGDPAPSQLPPRTPQCLLSHREWPWTSSPGGTVCPSDQSHTVPCVRWHVDVQPDDLILESFCMGGISCNVLTGLEGPASGLQADEGHFLKAGFVYFGKNPASCF